METRIILGLTGRGNQHEIAPGITIRLLGVGQQLTDGGRVVYGALISIERDDDEYEMVGEIAARATP